jgi:Xaa-Pro dipeptidase
MSFSDEERDNEAARCAELWRAQLRAEELFDTIVARGLIRAGVLESDLNEEIHQLAQGEFGVDRHWHRRIVRSGENTLTTFRDNPPDRIIQADDVVYLDLGPVFGEWESDYGRTYVLGKDRRKQQLVHDIMQAFRKGQLLYEQHADLTAGKLFDYVAELAKQGGWEFGAPTAGHIIDRFPHARSPARHEVIRSGNPLPLRQPLADGQPRHWILEIHFVDRERGYGGFLEELLTIRGARPSRRAVP